MHALRVLEFESVKSMLVEHCETAPGSVLAQDLLPQFDEAAVWFEIERTAEADALLATDGLSMSGVRDVSARANVASKGAVLEGAHLYQIGESLATMRRARDVLEPKRADFPFLWQLGERFPSLQRLEERLLNSLDGDGYVRDEASIELGNLRKRRASLAQKILDRVQSYVSGRTRDLLSDAVYTQRDGRYVIPLKAENKGKIKGIVHDTSASGATVYLEPEDVVAMGNELRQAEAMERAEVDRILKDLSERVGAEADVLRDGLDAASELDLVLGKARLGRTMKGTIPLRIEGPAVSVKNARHPLLPREDCVPLTLELGGSSTDVLLITGPNTGGKTVAIKTVGLCVVMAQSGLMPPAETIRIGCFSQIWADIGDEQSLQQSLSTFSGHIKNIANALGQMRAGCLVLLDEVGAGTDPGEGASLARALLLSFQNKGAKVMASTHYGELKLLASNTEGFMNASMEFDLKSLKPTYRLLVGVPGSSHAMKIAERYGIPPSIIEEATKGVSDEDLDVAKVIERLAVAQKQAQKAQGEADSLAARLRTVEKEAEKKIAQAEEARRSVRERATEELESLLRAIRLEAEDIFEELKKSPDQVGIDKARMKMKQLQSVGREFVEETRPKKPEPVSRTSTEPVQKGALVRISGLTQTGTVLDEPKNGQVLVQAGPLKMTCKVRDLSVIPSGSTPAPRSRSGSMAVNKAMSASTELHLRQMRAEDAQHELEKFIDEAVLGGLQSIRIVHGKGEGVLRKLTQDALRKHRDVRSFREGDPEEGGAGVTIAVLK